MGSLTNLLKWKKTITILDKNGKPVFGEDGKPRKVYMRVVGDQALKESYSIARVVSAEKRKRLRDTNSMDYKTEVDIFEGASKEATIQSIKIANASVWTSQAMSVVVRPDEIGLETVAADPDAPTLEEQEKCDALNKEQNEKYVQSLQEYVLQQSNILETELALMSEEELKEVAKKAQIDNIPLGAFLERVQMEKTWRGCFDDEKHTVHSFDNFEDFIDLETHIKAQLISEYTKLEFTGEDAKN